MTIEHFCEYEICAMDVNKAERVLNEVKYKLKLQFWLGAGTALGLYRDNKFIKNDTDIDIEMLYSEGIENALTAQLGFKLFRRVTHDGKPHQLCFISKGVLVDIYIYHSEGENYVNYYEWGKLVFPKELFNGVKYINTRYGKFPFPAQPEAYLKHRYNNWRKPSNSKGIYKQSK
jgi:hypothetical protein